MRSTRFEVKLLVARADEGDVNRDLVRIHYDDRIGLKSGIICLISNKDSLSSSSKYFVLRGLPRGTPSTIQIDEGAREVLGVSLGRQAVFQIEEAGWWGALQWAWSATDPAYRIAAKLGVLSFGLGCLSVVLAGVSITLAFMSR